MYKLPEQILSKYEFVTLASQRAEQLQMGAAPRVERADRRATVVAQEEVATGLIGIWNPDEEAEEDATVEEE